jgi:Skp family chaperone for outer membrane proteins
MSSILRALVGATTVLLVSAAGPLAAQSAAPQRLAYVDTRKILDAAPGRTEAEAQLQKEAAVWEAEIKKMQDSMNGMITDFQKTSGTMTQAAKDKRTKEIQDKQVEYQKRNDEINAEADHRRNELLQPILDQIKIALEDVRVSTGNDVIFDVGTQASIVAVNKNLDVSDRVIARLRVLGAPAVPAKSAVPTPSSSRPAGMPVSAPAGIGRPSQQSAPAKPDTTKKPDDHAPGE